MSSSDCSPMTGSRSGPAACFDGSPAVSGPRNTCSKESMPEMSSSFLSEDQDLVAQILQEDTEPGGHVVHRGPDDGQQDNVLPSLLQPGGRVRPGPQDGPSDSSVRVDDQGQVDVSSNERPKKVWKKPETLVVGDPTKWHFNRSKRRN